MAWKVDKAHTEIKFKARHLLVSTVTGYIKEFDAEICAEKEDWTDAQVKFDAELNSLTTNNEQRDAHLRTADFFDITHHPKMTFESKSIKKKSDDEYEVVGDLTIRGITKPVKLKVEYGGKTTGFGGVEVAGFEITGKVNRFDYGLNWNALTEAGGIVVSEDIRIDINAEFQKQKQ
jgi:polyisoprenoid-binding protein YceI